MTDTTLTRRRVDAFTVARPITSEEMLVFHSDTSSNPRRLIASRYARQGDALAYVETLGELPEDHYGDQLARVPALGPSAVLYRRFYDDGQGIYRVWDPSTGALHSHSTPFDPNEITPNIWPAPRVGADGIYWVEAVLNVSAQTIDYNLRRATWTLGAVATVATRTRPVSSIWPNPLEFLVVRGSTAAWLTHDSYSAILSLRIRDTSGNSPGFLPSRFVNFELSGAWSGERENASPTLFDPAAAGGLGQFLVPASVVDPRQGGRALISRTNYRDPESYTVQINRNGAFLNVWPTSGRFGWSTPEDFPVSLHLVDLDGVHVVWTATRGGELVRAPLVDPGASPEVLAVAPHPNAPSAPSSSFTVAGVYPWEG